MKISKTIHLFSIFSLILLFYSCREDCIYSFRLPVDEYYVYEVGDSLLYQCSDGSADTFQVDAVEYDLNIESYPAAGFITFSDRRCTYGVQDCDIQLRNLNGFWETFDDSNLFGPDPDSSRCFRIRIFGDFGIDDGVHTCSKIQSGCGDTISGKVSEACFEGEQGPSFSSSEQEFYNVFSEERQVQIEETGHIIHYRIRWTLKHGIIRFEDLASIPVRQWDLVGKIE